MTPFEASLIAWIGGGTVGAIVAKEHRAIGFVVGALVSGVVLDKVIERNPQYFNPRPERLELPGPSW